MKKYIAPSVFAFLGIFLIWPMPILAGALSLLIHIPFYVAAILLAREVERYFNMPFWLGHKMIFSVPWILFISACEHLILPYKIPWVSLTINVLCYTGIFTFVFLVHELIASLLRLGFDPSAMLME